MVLREPLVIKVAGADTGGRFSVIDCTSPPGFEPGTHTHQDEDEAFLTLPPPGA